MSADESEVADESTAVDTAENEVPRPTTAPAAGEAGPGEPADPAGPGVSAGSGPPPKSDAESAERELLEGPHSRLEELRLLFRAMRDFVRGFRALHFVGPCVTIFGSARFGESHPYYALARDVGRRVSELGFTVMTGGGPGLMEAANRGARDAGGLSVGCNIQLPHEQAPNAYLDRWVTCYYFFVRKVLLFKYSYAFVVLPGGLGTMDELAEALTLIQTGKIEGFPVVLIGTKYWAPLLALLADMIREGAVAASDLNLFKVTDDLTDAMHHLETHAVDPFGLKRQAKPSWWLGERALARFTRRR
ncbi:MAG TPA: TIGR00730 family Rossman fold protein [Vicinamibacterales bacterium]